jgi:hypothetical protein
MPSRTHTAKCFLVFLLLVLLHRYAVKGRSGPGRVRVRELRLAHEIARDHRKFQSPPARYE